MFYIDSREANFDLHLSLGDRETLDPPPLAIGFKRYGTNEVLVFDKPTTVIPGVNFVKIEGLDTSLFEGTGQYQYQVFDDTVPEDRLLIEMGLCIVTTDPITKKQYGTDKKRGEYKGHL